MPQAVISPATSASSLIATGTPPSGLSSSPRVVGVGLGQRALGEDDAVGAKLGIEAVDLRERRLDDLAGGGLAVTDQAGLLGGPGVGEIVRLHGRERTQHRPAPPRARAATTERASPTLGGR